MLAHAANLGDAGREHGIEQPIVGRLGSKLSNRCHHQLTPNELPDGPVQMAPCHVIVFMSSAINASTSQRQFNKLLVLLDMDCSNCPRPLKDTLYLIRGSRLASTEDTGGAQLVE